jgi:hypothetical protein
VAIFAQLHAPWEFSRALKPPQMNLGIWNAPFAGEARRNLEVSRCHLPLMRRDAAQRRERQKHSTDKKSVALIA